MDTMYWSPWLVEEDGLAFLEIYFVEAVDLEAGNDSQRWGDTLLTSLSAPAVAVEPAVLAASIR
jgi:hypothetical protein